MAKSEFINNNLNVDTCYQLTNGLCDTLLKYKFYKSILLFFKLIKGDIVSDDFDIVKKYIDNVINLETINSSIKMELLLLQRDLIMIKYLSLKTI